MNRVLCLWLPEWPIQRLVVARPELKSATLALYARDPRRGQRVIACCDQARAAGVAIGMPVAEVAAIRRSGQLGKGHAAATRPWSAATASVALSRRPKLVLEEHQPDLDNQALQELVTWCEQFSPIVGLEQTPQPDTLLLDITGVAHLFGDELQLARVVTDSFAQRGYHVRVGIADTIGMAWGLAHYAETAPAIATPRRPGNVCTQSHTLATAEVREAEPEFATTRDSTPRDSWPWLAEQLGELPLTALRLPASTVETLHQLGVLRIAELLQLPRHGLATRLGKELIRRIDQATGEQTEVIVAHRAAPTFSAVCLLEHATDRREAIEMILADLADQIAAKLAQHDHAVIELEATLFTESQNGTFGDTSDAETSIREESRSEQSHTLRVCLFQPSRQAEHLDSLLRLQLETTQLPHPVQRIQLEAITTVRITGQQQPLWEDLGLGASREVAMLVDRLSSRLGAEHVFRVQTQAGALPERAYRQRPFTGQAPRRRNNVATSTSPDGVAGAEIPRRPLWLQEPPLPLPEANQQRIARSLLQPPAFFSFQNVAHVVTCYAGPERIETGWWRGTSIRRDYYQVETATGAQFWIFRRLSDGNWFLHGYFE